jgi:TolB-like protein/tRNA A-37 threonylcarbamoyl transferase component Bud32/Flp pilus assembly protein TadD
MTSAVRACASCQTPLPEAAQFCMTCGRATPTDPGVPPRLMHTGAFEVAKVTSALAGRYRIERVLGEGGMATVYLAEDAKHKRKVAVKVMRSELAATIGAERFLREVEIAAQLSHPHILPMHDSGEADGLLYYVMPYVDGETLRERMVREGALAPEEALKLAREVTDALAYAHSRGIIHRDIKPANILLSAGHALVADFGIARAVEDGGGESLTKTGLAVGTPQYMAPEQATGEKDVDGRADLYAVGSMLYEMLSGAPPFTGANARAVLTKSLTEAPRPVSAARAGVPAVLDPLLEKALAKSADDRFATAESFMAAMDGLRQGTPTPMSPVSAIRPPATQVTAAASARRGVARWLTPRNVLVAGVGAAAVFFALRGRSPSSDAPAATGPRGNRVAVLPFRNEMLASDKYLADGVAMEIRDELATVGSLIVIGSTSSDEYRDSRKTPQEIASELRADALLTGVVRWTGDGAARSLALEPELIDARTGKSFWRKSIEQEEPAIMRLPGAAAGEVARALGKAPSAAEQADLDRPSTTSAESFRAYLRGREVAGNDAATLRGKIQEFEQAVVLDSMFAEAWGRLSSLSTTLYVQGNRDPKVALRARQALERLLALLPTHPFARSVHSSYLQSVAGDEAAARAELDLALREWPNNAFLLSTSGAQDMNVGDLGSALTKLERARELDPRNSGMLSNLLQAYTFLGRPTDAEAVGATLLAVRPLNTSAVQAVAIAHLSNADLAGAREVLRAALQRGVPAPRVVTQMAGFYETGFALEDADQQLLLRLTPATFDDDRAWWAQTMATMHWQRGDTALARAYADSAIAPTKAQIAGAPTDPQLHGLLALMLAYAGRSAEARASLQQSLSSVDRYSLRTYNLVNAAKTELALGNRDAAIAHLKLVRRNGFYVTNGWLQVDPTYASLKDYPPFEQMLQGK